jgi:uncharacterized membrane protein YbhN (UPF0104 family)
MGELLLIDGIEVAVQPRHRERSASAVLRLLIAIALLGIGLVIRSWGRNTILGAEADIVLAYERLPNRFAEILNGLAWITAAALPTLGLLVLLITGHFRRAAALFLGGTAALVAMVALDSVMTDHSVLNAVEEQLGHPINLNSRDFATSPLLASVVAMVVIASPWLSDRWRRALLVGVAVLTLLRIVSSGEPPLDLIIAVALGLAIGSLALVVFGSPSSDPDGPEIVRLVRAAATGDPARIEQQEATSPLDYLVTMRDGTLLDLRLRTPHDRSADLLDRLWRYVRLRSVDSDAPFSTLSRRVEHEALVLTMAAKAGARVRDVRTLVTSSNGCIGLMLEHIPDLVPAVDPEDVLVEPAQHHPLPKAATAAAVPPVPAEVTSGSGSAAGSWTPPPTPPSPGGRSEPTPTTNGHDENAADAADHEDAPPRFGRAELVELWRQVALLHRRRIAHRALTLAHVGVRRQAGTPTRADTDSGTNADANANADTDAEASARSNADPEARANADAQPGADPDRPPLVVLDSFDRARLAASERDLSVDTAQLVVDSALHLGAEPAVEAAISVLGPQAVMRAVPFLQPPALPWTTRKSLRANKAVLDEIRRAVQRSTDAELAPLDRLDRIRPRTALSIAAVAVAFYVLLPQLAHAEETAHAAVNANWWWLAPILAGSAMTYVFAAIAFVASAPGPVPFFAALRLQVASSFVSQIAPANTGRLAAGVRFLQRAGFEPAAATTAVGLNAVGALAVHLTLMTAFIAWTGTSGVGGFSLPQANTILVVIAVVVSASGLAVGLVPSLRRRVGGPLMAQARTAAAAVATVVTDPMRVVSLLAGGTGITLSYTLTLAAAIQAFGGGVSFPQIGAAFMVSSALASAAPTPGGLGALEAALVAALTGYGMADGEAVSAVLTFRLATLWLPILPGWLTFQQMQRRGEL